MDESEWPVRIIVLDRGFVLACRCPEPLDYALWLPYRHRRTVRRWGTTQGLGELVNGPLPGTALDAIVPAGKVPVRAVLDVMEPTTKGAERWASVLTETSEGSPTGSGGSRSRTGSRNPV